VRANVSIIVKLPENRSDLVKKLSTLDIRLNEEPSSPALNKDDLINLPDNQTTELFVTHAYGIDAIRNAKHAAHLIQQAGGEATVGEKTVTVDADNRNLTSTNASFGAQLRKLIEAKKYDPGLAIFDEITFASKTYDEAEDRVVANPAVR
jgi:hypothetical protein